MTVVVTVNVEGRYRGFLRIGDVGDSARRVHISPDDEWHTGTDLGRADTVALRAEARRNSDDLARPYSGG